MRTEITKDAKALSAYIADWLLHQANQAVSLRGRFMLSLAGGSTPKLLYQALAAQPYFSEMPWYATHLFWGDERFVPPDHPDSNYRMVKDALLSQAPIPPANVHAMPTDGSPAGAAMRYEATLRNFNGSAILDPVRPLFDVTLLGLGTDGHTASLFPGTAVLDEDDAWVQAVEGVKPEVRLTLTYPIIASSRTIAFVVTGADKTTMAAKVRAGDTAFPAARVKTSGEIIWFMDQAAASSHVPA